MSLRNAGASGFVLSAALFSALAGFTLLPAPVAAASSTSSTAVTAAATAQVNNFTSSDWLLGTWRKSAGFSIPANAANKAAFTKGAQVRLADGQVRTILAVYFSGAHMSAMLSGAKLNASATGYPHKVTALSSTPTQTSPASPSASAGTAHSSAINNYTNSDWINGVWRKSAGFSIPTNSANAAAFKPGASVKLANGQVRSITAVYTSGQNMSVMLAGSTLSGSLGYPNKLYAAAAASSSGSASPSSPSTPKPAPSTSTGSSSSGSSSSGSSTTAPSNPTPPTSTTPSAPTALTVALNSFNGGDFTFGIYRRAPGISVKDTDANRAAFHKGAKVRFADGQIRTVTLYYRFGGNMTVLLDGGSLDGRTVGFPRTVSVSSTGFSQTAPTGGNAQTGTPAPANPINLVGINLAGAEFSSGSLPGVYLKHYIYPGDAEFKRYASLNLKLVRLPFRWERLQPKLNQPLNAAELGRLLSTLDLAKKHGMQVILDMHNYYRYHGKLIASNEVPISAFADSWKRIASQVANHPAVYGYGLMNEPHSTNGKWPAAALAAAKAIRAVDAKRWIYVAGDRWSSAYHWPSYNIQLISDAWMRDPKNNLVYEAHLYLDSDYSGTYANTKAVYDPMTGVNRAKPFVEWLKKYRLRGFIGEHGVPDFSPSAVVAMDNLLKYLGQQCIPSTYWAAGPWWGDYALSLDVKSGKARPQLPVLQKHAANKSCGTIGLY
ncbi:glycoside hydrolase family 5 protein [Stutzerimonas marianensis]|uniref:glycoside hydrolase family 5 protein n=1 Tax=Stutzerimonas marianensis TaxID=2929513 RepID=UPI003C2F7F72